MRRSHLALPPERQDDSGPTPPASWRTGPESEVLIYGKFISQVFTCQTATKAARIYPSGSFKMIGTISDMFVTVLQGSSPVTEGPSEANFPFLNQIVLALH